jgi:hypothetical protein
MNYNKIIAGLVLTWSALSQLFSQQTWWFIQNVNLIFHEAGHVIFMFFGQFITTLGGSLLEILIPFSIVLYFTYTKQYFSASFSSWWLSTALLSVSIYAKDAKERTLPLITNDINTHDWYNLLNQMNLLNYDDVFGYIFWCGGLVSAGFILFFLTKDKDVRLILEKHTRQPVILTNNSETK